MKASPFVFAFWFFPSTAAGQTPAISVRLYNYAGVPEGNLEKAKLESQRVLRVSAFEVRWLDCPPSEDQREARHLACTAPWTQADIILRIVPRSMQPREDLSRSLGYALPFVGRPPNRAYVLYDRVRERIRACEGITEFRLLGYVMAHEIAHLLFGDDRHYSRGVMMASWREKDLAEIERGTMAFSQHEVSLLEAGGIARMQSYRQE